MELGEFAIGTKQIRGISLTMASYLQNVHVKLLHAVMLLESHHFNYLQATILLHAVSIIKQPY